MDCHRGEEKPQFGANIITSFSSCMVWQHWECIRIRWRLTVEESYEKEKESVKASELRL